MTFSEKKPVRTKRTICYEILALNLFILAKLCGKFGLFHFEDSAFFYTAYGQIWHFRFLEPGNPAHNILK